MEEFDLFEMFILVVGDWWWCHSFPGPSSADSERPGPSSEQVEFFLALANGELALAVQLGMYLVVFWLDLNLILCNTNTIRLYYTVKTLSLLEVACGVRLPKDWQNETPIHHCSLTCPCGGESKEKTSLIPRCLKLAGWLVSWDCWFQILTRITRRNRTYFPYFNYLHSNII